jgi:hypothetical protein
MSQRTVGPIKNEQSRDAGNIWYKTQNEDNKIKRTTPKNQGRETQMLTQGNQFLFLVKMLAVLLIGKSSKSLVGDRRKIKVLSVTEER